MQLYREYRHGVARVQDQLAEVDRIYRGSLAEALWRLDQAQVTLELEGMLRLSDISAVQVRESGGDPLVVSAGHPAGGAAVISRDFPIMREVQGAQRMIGTLHVEATLSDLYRSLANTAALILVNQATNTFLVALFITWLLNRIVTRHLAAIARAVAGYDHRDLPMPLILDRRERPVPDELDRVVSAINAMAARVYRAYLDERYASAERQARHAAEAARDELELRVTRRTEQLARANDELREQIAERERAQARLALNEARLREIVEVSPIPLSIGSLAEPRMLYANEQWRELFGVAESELPHISLDEFYVEQDGRRKLLERIALGGRVTDTEVPVRRRDGAPFWATITARLAAFQDEPAIYVGFHDVTERKRIEQELLESREQLRLLSAHMEAIREEERKRIALEIHDELGQLLTALKMDVSLLKMSLGGQPELLKKVIAMRDLVEQTMLMVRNVANHLRPAALNFGLVSALEWLTEDFGKRTGIVCRLVLNADEPDLTDAHATALFRVVQESTTNIARHARATRVHVTMMHDESGLVLNVSDNGCGFDPAACKRGSYGLLGMSERARLIGASLQIDSAIGSGTVVSISIPVENGREDDQDSDRG
ncbi:PAS domain S-box protein [Trinickia dinghuensis]|uniref:histidine kinase n=2 Tax=Trinickia dinghuensis TaxID=2291023 RepID=A0A3D8K7R2_9BURK|nr:PAS domain S-box protein [Trinickia dinghuensis]